MKKKETESLAIPWNDNLSYSYISWCPVIIIEYLYSATNNERRFNPGQCFHCQKSCSGACGNDKKMGKGGPRGTEAAGLQITTYTIAIVAAFA